jgi:hypothetical protein
LIQPGPALGDPSVTNTDSAGIDLIKSTFGRMGVLFRFVFKKMELAAKKPKE